MPVLTKQDRAFRARYANILKLIRAERGWTQAEAARRCNVQPIYYRRVEQASAAVDRELGVKLLRAMRLKKTEATALVTKAWGK